VQESAHVGLDGVVEEFADGNLRQISILICYEARTCPGNGGVDK
jgi:hypothetical protein